MFKLETEEALLAAFRHRDRKLVRLAPEVRFPLFVRDYVAWTQPSGGRVFLVFAVKGGLPTGVAFDTQDGSGPSVPHMCDWCHCGGMGTQVGLITAAFNSKKRVGVQACVDLSCAKRLEEQADLSGVSPRPAMEKLLERMGRFASEALRIDLFER